MNRLNPTIIFALTGIPLLAAAFVAVLLTMGGQPKPVQYAAVLSISYLLGSVPWGYILLKMRMGVDIRQYGSGRTGMSNVLRTAGGKVAALVLLLDVSKGVLPVFLARTIIGASEADVAAALLDHRPQLACVPGIPRWPGHCHRGWGANHTRPNLRRRWIPCFCFGHFCQPLRLIGFHHRRSCCQPGHAGARPFGLLSHSLHPLRFPGRRNHHLAAPRQHPEDPGG